MTRNSTATRFLDHRSALTRAGNVDDLERLDETLRDLAAADPDAALEIIEQLSASNDTTAREAAAIYAQYLVPARRERAADLLASLLNDTNPDIARQALQTIDTVTQDPNLSATQAADRITKGRARS